MLSEAAEVIGSEANYILATCYENGIGVKKDMEKAIELYRNMSHKNKAYFKLNTVCKKWLEEKYIKPAEQGDVQAQLRLGEWYLEDYNKLFTQDVKKAAEWLLKAAKQGAPKAQFLYGLCLHYGEGGEQNDKKAAEWFLKAAEQGYRDAQHNIGVSYHQGLGVEQNYQKAFEWFMKAAKQGDPLSQHKLGYCYENGEGVEKDIKKAIEWYQKAAKQGHEDSILRLESLK